MAVYGSPLPTERASVRVAALQQDRARVPAHGPRWLGTEFIRAMRCHVFTLDDWARTLELQQIECVGPGDALQSGAVPGRSLVMSLIAVE
ncbi:hypothetical protein BSZ18_01745 [Bradyrhizobium canariense]|uniref:Uncharacterized protein n=1 Tax=Bradyrhizobium canariense TaxID=255045 RepID=A0A1X3HGE0_9BRAD|nr:hypothetical protein BSZ18_01745 [Bradyrhizobium canariense]